MNLEGGFSKTFNESGVFSNSFNGNAKNTDVILSVDYMVNKSFAIGIGVEYLRQKEERANSLLIIMSKNTIMQEAYSDISSEAIMPLVHFKHFKEIFNNLYFCTTMGFEYGNVKTITHSVYVSALSYPVDSSNYLIPYTNNTSGNSLPMNLDKTSNSELFVCNLKPSLIYFISPHIGFNLEVGGIDYVLTKWDFDLAQWNINFYPSNWKFGLQLKF
jgi:hypothetical protein